MTHRKAIPSIAARTMFGLALIVAVARNVVFPQVGHAQTDAQQRQFFENRIRPVLVKHCYACHSAEAEAVKGGLLVDSAPGLLKGGDSGPAVAVGDPQHSLLIEALRYDGLEMPPAGRLPEAVIQDFERLDPRRRLAPKDASVQAVASAIDLDAGRRHWAFQPLQRQDAVPIAESSWPENLVDRFLLSRMQSAGISPNSDADPTTLVRRLYYDLIGLPPTPAQLADALDGDFSETYPRTVDHLLQSPEFGVHWARHWLDVARYADSNGGDFNATFHNAWRYRNYVVDAMNRDKPFNQFVKEQIAGDLLPADTDAQRTDQIVATGFLMLGAKMLSERDKEKLTMDVVDEQITAVGSAMLGLTLGCARCHDHKFDPIATRDYYALAGVFRNTRTLQGESQKYVSTWKKVDLPVAKEDATRFQAHQQAVKQLKDQQTKLAKQLEQARLTLASEGLLIDDDAAMTVGAWKSSSLTPKYIGRGYIHDNNQSKGDCSATFVSTPKATAEYELRISYCAGSGRANNVPVAIRGQSLQADLRLDQTRKPAVNELFQPIGRFRLTANLPVEVTISNADTQGHVIVDAVQWVRLDDAGKPVPLQPPNEQDATPAPALATLEARIASWKNN